MRTIFHWTMFTLVFFVLAIIGCGRSNTQYPSTGTEYQSILLISGQVFFGKIQKDPSSYLLVKDVYYIQSQIDKETKQVRNNLVRRGNELHGPNEMFINPSHIVAIEPVTINSKLIELIKELDAEKKATEGKKKSNANY